MESEPSQSKRICLHCPETERKPILITNFTRHIQKKHNGRYQELIDETRKRCNKPEYRVDFIWYVDPKNDNSLLINNNKRTKAMTEIDEEIKS